MKIYIAANLSTLMKRTSLLLLLIFLSSLIVLPAWAANETTLCFSDLDLMAHSTLEIYGMNDTADPNPPNGGWDLLSIQNTGTCGLTFTPGQYKIIVRPSSTSRLTNPTLMLTDAFAFLESYWLQILLGFALVVMIIRRW